MKIKLCNIMYNLVTIKGQGANQHIKGNICAGHERTRGISQANNSVCTR